jgi:hypothetical protein
LTTADSLANLPRMGGIGLSFSDDLGGDFASTISCQP